MIDVKIIKKPKGASPGSTTTNVIRQASVAEEAVRAGRADKADYADNAGRADAAGYADKAGRAEVAYGLTDDNIIKDSFLSKTDDDTAAGNITFEQSINVGGNVVVGGDITARGDVNAVDITGSDLYATNNAYIDKAVEANSANIATTLTAAEVYGTTKVNTPLVEATTKVQTPRAEATEVITSSVKTADFNPDPLAGYGFGIYKDSTLNNDAKAVVDYLVVRKKMQVAVLEIAEYKSVNGGLVLSKANGVIESVEYTDDGTIYAIKLKERNQFVVGDLIRCQTWDMKIEPTSPLRYYWVEVQASSGLFIEV
ncbi:MAG: hypothetical protein IJS19_09035, partial [Muribaculaceae bacterium]|nr:hypothetical protein [Muribaculaceae bacterium]